MYKSKYPTLIDFLTNQEDLILLDSEIQNIENLIDKDLKAITVTHCCKSDSELLLFSADEIVDKINEQTVLDGETFRVYFREK